MDKENYNKSDNENTKDTNNENVKNPLCINGVSL